MSTFTYTEQQQNAIHDAITELRNDCADYEFRRFMDINRCGELRQRGSEYFAVFGDIAYKLLAGTMSDARGEFEFIPVLVDGNLIGRFPDEGQSGVLHLQRCLWRKNSDGSPRPGYPSAWTGNYLSGGWLRTPELAQSNAEIARHIIAEISDGQTPLTGGGLPGWE